MRRRDLLTGGVAALSAPLLARPVFGQGKFPDHPIRLVVPFPPGGGYDAVGRPLADKMKSALGSMVVENMGGGGSSLGAAAVARARPDGYTILLGGSSTHVTEAVLKSRPAYDPLKELEPIANLVLAAFAFAIHPSVPATADALSGQVQMITPAVTAPLLEYHRTGKLHILAVTSPKRLIAAPDIPTAVEAGVPNMISEQSIGLLAPAGTPRAIIEQIFQASRSVLADQSFQRMLIESGFEPDLESNPQAFRRLIEADIARWAPLVTAIGVRL